MAIDPRHMMTLLAIAEEGSFKRAAERLNLSQPALSSAIATLEMRLGFRALERTSKGTTTNAYGDIIARRAQQLRALIDATEQEVREHSRGRSGPLTIGASPGMLLTVIPEMVSRMRLADPAQGMEIVEGWDDVLQPMLEAGELDFYVASVTSLDDPMQRTTEEELYRDPIALGVAPGSALLGQGSISIGALREAHWVLPRSGAHLRHVEAIFMAAGVPFPYRCVRTNSLSLTEQIVLRTGAVTIVSQVSMERPEPHGMCVVALQEAGHKRVVIRQRAQTRPSPAAQMALAILREVALAQPAVNASPGDPVSAVCGDPQWAP